MGPLRGNVLGLLWRKSSKSALTNDCVEVALFASGVAMRDSKNAAGPRLCFSGSSWRRFVDDVTADGFDPAARMHELPT